MSQAAPAGGRLDRVLYISDPSDLQHYHTAAWDRIYFGNECCHWLMPDASAVADVRRFCVCERVPFSLVTPPLPPAGLRRMEPLLDGLPPDTEVVVNDWGLIPAVRERGLNPVAGRLLVKVRRDPRMGSGEPVDVELQSFLRQSNLRQPAFQRFLFTEGIARVELDNLPQGWDLDLPPGLHTSLYHPYVIASVTRRCSLLYGVPLDAEGRCREGCVGQEIQASVPVNSTMRSGLRVQGALLFFENSVIPATDPGWRTDRLVWMPRPPAIFRPGSAIPEWNSVYRSLGNDVEWGVQPANRRLLELVEAHRTGPAPRTLDLGCGNGRHVEALAEAGHEVVGLDVSPSALQLARQRCPGARLVLASALDLPFDDASFDMVLDYGCFHAVAPRRQPIYSRQVAHVLRYGGILALFARQRGEDVPEDQPICLAAGLLPEWGFTLAQLDSLLGPGLARLAAFAYQGRGDERFWYVVFRRTSLTARSTPA